MKNIIKTTLIFLCAGAIQSCSLDNYDQPDVDFMGRITYQGEPLQLRHGSIKFDLTQNSFELGDKLEVSITQDGTFTTKLFAGKYTFSPRGGNGPWMDDSEAIDFNLKKGTTIDYQVTPYYLLQAGNIQLNHSTITAECSIKKIAGDKTIETLTLFVGKTRFVDDRGGRSVVSKNFDQPATGVCSVSLDIADQMDKHAVIYARIGLKISGIDERIYTQVVKIK